MARIPGLDELKNQNRVLTDIATKVERIAAASSGWGQNYRDAAESAGDLATKLDAYLSRLEHSKGPISPDDIRNVKDMEAELNKLTSSTFRLQGIVDKLGKGFDKLALGIAGLWGSGATKGVNLLIDAIQRVYDLEERWAKVTGEVNQKLGGLSPNMRQFYKDARYAESAIRGLGGELGEGTKLFAEFVASFGKMDDSMQDWSKLSVQLAQGFNLGGDAAGKMARALDEMGFDEKHKEASKLFADMTVDAKSAGVSVNALAKDFADATNFVGQFGKAGAKALVQSAAHLKRFNISLRDAEKMMSKFDTFEDAATNVSKLNTVFGTTINSLDMMLEQDPAKRFEKIRQGLLAQGKTYESLSRSQRQFLEQTTGLDQAQIAAMLSDKNRSKSLEDIQKETDKREKAEANAQKLMQEQLRKTAKTLFNFGAAMDRITVAIGKAIKPFLVMLGLAKDSNKPFTSFGEIMEGITEKIEGFFEALANNPDWYRFMQKAADATKKAAAFIAEFFEPDNLAKNIQWVIDKLAMLWDWSKKILEVWAGFKVAQMGMNLANMFGAAGTMGKAAGIGEAAGGRIQGLLGKVGIGGGGGLGVGRSGATPVWIVGSDIGGGFGGIGGGGGNEDYASYEITGGQEAGPPGKQPGRLGRMFNWFKNQSPGKRGMFSGALGGAAAGVLSSLVEGKGAAHTIGAGVGGAAAGGLAGLIPVIGPFIAPIAGKIGAELGGKIGEAVGEMMDSPEEAALRMSAKDLADAQAELEAQTKANTALETAIGLKRKIKQKQEEKTDLAIHALERKAKKQNIEVTGQDRESILARIKEMDALGIKTNLTKEQLAKLADPKGSVSLSAANLKDLEAKTKVYNTNLGTYTQEVSDFAQHLKSNFADQTEMQKAKLDADKAELDAQIELAKMDVKKRDAEKGWTDSFNVFSDEAAQRKGRLDLAENHLMTLQAKRNEIERSSMEIAIRKAKIDKAELEMKELLLDQSEKGLAHFQAMATQEFQKAHPGQALDSSAIMRQALRSFMAAGGKISNESRGVYGLAEGGIVTRPTVRMVGEAGPEAVVPLPPAVARGMVRSARSVTEQSTTNFAPGARRGKAAGGSSEVKVVAGDVYLDSKKVGRHLVRQVLADARE